MAELDLNIILKLIDNASAEFKKINSESIKQLNDLRSAGDSVKKSTDTIDSSLKSLGNTINKSTSAYDDMANALSSTDSNLKTIEKTVDSNISSYDDMSKAVSNSRSIFENFSVEVTKRTEEMKSSLTSLSEKFDDSAKQLKSLGRDISQLGGAISLVGGAISAIFIKALSDSSKYSKETQTALQNLNVVSTQFSIILAQSVVPIINKLTSILQLLLNAFNSIDPELRTSILQFVFWSGIILTAVGSLTFLIGKVITFISGIKAVIAITLEWTAANLALIPTMAIIYGSIAALLILMYKFKPVADLILNTLQILFINFKNNIILAQASVELFVSVSLGLIAKIFEALAKIPGPSQKAFTILANAMVNASGDAKVLAQRDLNQVIVNSREIGAILQSGQGKWSTVFQEVKDKAGKAGEAIKGILSGVKSPELPNLQDNQINLLRAENDLKNFNDELEKQKQLFLSGQISADEYYQTLTDSQQSVIFANQQLAQELENLATATSNSTFKMSIAIVQLKIKLLEVKDALEQGIGQAFAKMIFEGQKFGDALKNLFKSIAESFIAEVGRMIAKWLAFLALKAVGKFFGFSQGSGDVQGGVQGFAQGGFVNPLKLASGTDTIPAMLTPGEIVVPRSISDSIRQGELSLSGPKEKSGDSFGDVIVNINYPKLTSKEEMMELVNNIGFEIQKQMRYVRG